PTATRLRSRPQLLCVGLVDECAGAFPATTLSFRFPESVAPCNCYSTLRSSAQCSPQNKYLRKDPSTDLRYRRPRAQLVPALRISTAECLPPRNQQAAFVRADPHG